MRIGVHISEQERTILGHGKGRWREIPNCTASGGHRGRHQHGAIDAKQSGVNVPGRGSKADIGNGTAYFARRRVDNNPRRGAAACDRRVLLRTCEHDVEHIATHLATNLAARECGAMHIEVSATGQKTLKLVCCQYRVCRWYPDATPRFGLYESNGDWPVHADCAGMNVCGSGGKSTGDDAPGECSRLKVDGKYAGSGGSGSDGWIFLRTRHLRRECRASYLSADLPAGVQV